MHAGQSNGKAYFCGTARPLPPYNTLYVLHPIGVESLQSMYVQYGYITRIQHGRHKEKGDTKHVSNRFLGGMGIGENKHHKWHR